MNENETQFSKYLETLRAELDDIKGHYDCFQKLADAQSNYNEEMNKAPSFWGTTIRAHLGMCLYGLMRLLVDNKDSLTIHKLLNYAENNNQTLFKATRLSGTIPSEEYHKHFAELQREYQGKIPQRLEQDRADLKHAADS